MYLRLFGGKGGVGKTTLAAAAALGVAEGRLPVETAGTALLAGRAGDTDEAHREDAGRHGGAVLLVSTDPAHSLGDALGRRLGPDPVSIPIQRGALWAAEMSAGRALAGWLAPRREALIALAERGTFLDNSDVTRLLDLGLPGIDELAGVLAAVRAARRLGCDELVLDTAPTAHTLRLLGMPATLRGFAALLSRLAAKPRLMAETFGGAWRPDEADAAAESIAGEAQELEELLRDPGLTRFTWVLLPEEMSVAETLDGLAALEEMGVPVGEVIVNRLTPPAAAARCEVCAARREAELAAVERLQREVPHLLPASTASPPRAATRKAERPRHEIPYLPLLFVPAMNPEPRGLPALRRLARNLAKPSRGKELLRPLPRPARHAGLPHSDAAEGRTGEQGAPSGGPPAWLATLTPPDLELLLVGGKGGVGKTTCAAAVALAAARQRPEAPVRLLSADPAHSLGDALAAELGDDERPLPGGPPNLLCREIEPESALSRWRARFGDAAEDLLATLTGLPRSTSDEAAADLLGLTPPGLDELAVLDALMDLFPAGASGLEGPPPALVIVDTAPTGHALRLLAMPETALEWDHALLSLLLKYREAVAPGPLAAELVELSRGLKRLSALLHDPRRARFAVVTRAAELPRRETLRLLDALGEAGIAPAALLLNALPEPSPAGCPRCAREAAAAGRQLARLQQDLARRQPGDTGPASGGCAMILAPAEVPPPRGAEALAAWSRAWRVGSSTDPR